MAKVYFDSKDYIEKVFNNLSNACTKLDRVDGLVATLSVPSDFRYYSYLTNLRTNTSPVRNKCNAFMAWANSNLARWENLKLKKTLECGKIEVIRFQKRNMLVK